MSTTAKKKLIEPKKYKISALDAVVLIMHIMQGAKSSDVGFEDTQYSLGQFKALFHSTIEVPQDMLESALWSSNLMNEVNAFWHPDELTFDQFVKRLIPAESNEVFDKFYNYVKTKRGIS